MALLMVNGAPRSKEYFIFWIFFFFNSKKIKPPYLSPTCSKNMLKQLFGKVSKCRNKKKQEARRKNKIEQEKLFYSRMIYKIKQWEYFDQDQIVLETEEFWWKKEFSWDSEFRAKHFWKIAKLNTLTITDELCNLTSRLWLLQMWFFQDSTFLDYIRGGVRLNLVVGVDMTSSNGDPNSTHSLHSIDKR